MSVFSKILDRRRRYKLPVSMKLLAVVLFLFPVINFLIAKEYTHLPFTEWRYLWNRFGLVGQGLLIAAPLVGISILFPSKQTWWILLTFAAVLVLHNLYQLLQNPSPYLSGMLIRAILGSLLFVWFLQRDIRAPYLGIYQRGFRRNKRKAAAHLKASIGGSPYQIQDLSKRGVYLLGETQGFYPGQEVEIVFGNKEKDKRPGVQKKLLRDKGKSHFPGFLLQKTNMRAGIVRLDPDKGLGLAFRKMK